MDARQAIGSATGQGALEWVALVTLVLALLVAVGAAGVRLPGGELRPRRRLPRRAPPPDRPPRDLLGPAAREPLHPVLALLRGLLEPQGPPADPRPARRRRLPPRRLGELPAEDRRRRRGRIARQLAQLVQLRRRHHRLAVGHGAVPALGVGAVHGPHLRLWGKPRRPRPRGGRSARAWRQAAGRPAPAAERRSPIEVDAGRPPRA